MYRARRRESMEDSVVSDAESESSVSESESESESESDESESEDSCSSIARRCSMIRRGAFYGKRSVVAKYGNTPSITFRYSLMSSVNIPRPILVK